MPESNSPSTPKPYEAVHFLPTSPWLFPFAVCFLLVILFSAKKIGSYDLGFHLKAGQWIVQNHAFPKKDTFTYTQNSQDYIDAHGLYQILIYGADHLFGDSALTLLNMTVLLGFFFLIWLRMKLTHSPPWWSLLILLLSLIIMERRFQLRPEVFSWFFLALTLYLLELKNKGKDHLFLLPVVQLLWVNTEGLFLIGWAVMLAYLLSGWVHAKKVDPSLLKFFGLSIAADLLNPYFLKGLVFPFILFDRLNDPLYKQAISEFVSPFQALANQNLHFDNDLHIQLFFLMSIVTLVLFLLTLRERKFHDYFLLSIFLYLGMNAVRNLPLFITVDCVLLAQCFADWKSKPRWGWLYGQTGARILTLAALLLCLRVMTNAYYIQDRRLDRFGFGLDEERLPIKAAEFLNEKHLDGRILNYLNDGGWLDWKGPQPTYIDGRLEIPEKEFFSIYQESLKPGALWQLIMKAQPQIIFFEYNACYPWLDQLNHMPDWRLVYLDENTAIYALKDYAKDLPALSYPALLAQRRLSVSNEQALMGEVQNIPPSALNGWVEGFFKSQNYPMGTFSMGLFALRTAEYESAQTLFMDGLRQTRGTFDEPYFNLGVSSLHLKQYRLGRLCLEDVLQLNPNDVPSKRMLQSLPNE